jgi:hypothetical protein
MEDTKMRLWSIHPRYLDSKGLVALWREGLLAQNVLLGKTKGYKNHPQLIRFNNANDPALAITVYLHHVVDEADKRQYKFNRDKIVKSGESDSIPVTKGQLEYEFKHLLNKLKTRDPNRYDDLKSLEKVETHPMFKIVEGGIEEWEIIRDAT